MAQIKLSDICGLEVLSRANVRKVYDYVDYDTEILDMSGITFISRSVADELCNLCSKFNQLSLVGMCENVDTMLQIVNKGRSMNRDYTSKVKMSMTINCKTMDDLRLALLSYGG